jgi:hypothetical protein
MAEATPSRLATTLQQLHWVVTENDVLEHVDMEGENECCSEVFQRLERLTAYVMKRRWDEVGYNLTVISEAFSKPENR